MEYYNPEMKPKEQARRFKKDWKTETRETINSRLIYGWYDYTYDNVNM